MTTIMEKFRLDGKTAIVTGAGGLLGREFCRALAEAGANVIAGDINLESAGSAAELVELAGSHALPIYLDVGNPESTMAMTEAALKHFKSLDILVNSAGLDPKFDGQHKDSFVNDFERFPLALWEQGMTVNLTGMFLCAQAAVKPMLNQSGGVIINICSIYGMQGPDQRLYQSEGQPVKVKPVIYSVTKAGVLGLTHYLAAYYAGKGIRVNALTPGGVFNDQDEVFVKRYSAKSILGRMAEKDEMSGALVFLASEASSYMTGANLIVDGGWTAW